MLTLWTGAASARFRGYILPLFWLGACSAEPLSAERAGPWPFVERPALTVVVLGESGSPVPGAWVTLAPDGRDARADANGIATFHALDPGAREAIVAAPGFETRRAPVMVREDGERATLTLQERALTVAVLGQVTDPYGAPVSGVDVVVDGDPLARTGGDGIYLLEVPAGAYDLRFVPPGRSLGDWEAHVQVQGGEVQVDASLPGRTPDTAVHVGSTTCLFCHSGAGGPGEAWMASAHAQSARRPRELVGTELAEAFTAGEVVPLGPPDARAVLAAPSPDRWTVTLHDDGHQVGPLDVVEVYGGHRTAAAFAVELGGERQLLPLIFRLEDADPSPEGAGWVPAQVDGWYIGDALRAEPTDAVAFDLQCAGCHATGHQLDDRDGYALAPLYPRGEVERRVGCEACHGPGSVHIARPSQARLTLHNPGRLPPAQALQTCASCHERAEPDHWRAAPGSRTFADPVGELRLSPHRRGPSGYDGACEDCHDPHGSPHGASLRRPAWDNGLCTTCHRSPFPSRPAVAAHAGHPVQERPWGPGTCTGCHLPRSGHLARPDLLSGAGEQHSHGLWPFTPDDALAEFDARGVDTLPPHEVPVGGCIDCHLQSDAGPAGDPGARATFEALAPIYQGLWP